MVCGGDGLVHLGVQAVAGTGVPLGVIPSGTGNDFARYLDLPRTDPVAAADRVIASRRRTIDLARSGDRWFVTVLAAGFDAIVNERANRMTWPRGQMRYNLATLAELRTFRPIPYVLQLDGETVEHEAMLVAVGNGPSFGGGLRITEGALLDDGLLDVVVITRMSKPKLVRSYPRLFTGTDRRRGGVRPPAGADRHRGGARHRVVRRRRALRPAAPDRRVRPRRAGRDCMRTMSTHDVLSSAPLLRTTPGDPA